MTNLHSFPRTRRRDERGHDESEAQHFKVMAGLTRSVMAGLVPAIHVLLSKKNEERRGCPQQVRA